MVSPPAGKATAEGAAAPTTLPLPSHSKHGSKDGSTQTDGMAESSGQGEGTERPAGLLGESPRDSTGQSRGYLWRYSRPAWTRSCAACCR